MTLQFPVAITLMFSEEIVQIAGVLVLRVTVRPEEAVACDAITTVVPV